MNSGPLVVIVGPTASGKSSLAMRLAQEFDGEIISADSRAVYRTLDIGTAKPTIEDMRLVRHWGVDLVNPGERFTAADFQLHAREAIADIRSRGRIPLLVGGTGLYVNSIIYDYQFPPERPELRSKFDNWTVEQLKNYCTHNNIKLPHNYNNPRHLIDAIVRDGDHPKSSDSPVVNTLIVGITTERDTLRQRIAARADQFFASNVLDEARRAGDTYGWDSESMTGNIYPILHRLIDGEITIDSAKELFRISDWQLAKRQLTWFRRDANVRWLPPAEAYTYLARELAKTNK